ncbi:MULTISPECIES: hypothetical protein [unclassified Maridesulfovibrio]|uniref:hypothetical protein n=1 Tax=unclassified Maridesulfovibrio TaxID=2794999 RepID=UPI003B3C536A
MPEVEVKRVKRTWKEFFRDPVFARCWWDTDNEGNRHYTRAEAYEYPYWPECLIVPAEIHEDGHLKGLKGQSWPLDIMWEAPGRFADTGWEKAAMIVVGPIVLGRRIFTGDWFSKANRKLLDEYDQNLAEKTAVV